MFSVYCSRVLWKFPLCLSGRLYNLHWRSYQEECDVSSLDSIQEVLQCVKGEIQIAVSCSHFSVSCFFCCALIMLASLFPPCHLQHGILKVARAVFPSKLFLFQRLKWRLG